jgi:hypothetical protein
MGVVKQLVLVEGKVLGRQPPFLAAVFHADFGDAGFDAAAVV